MCGEYLLSLLLAHAGKVLTQRHILREVWGPTQHGRQPLCAGADGSPAPQARGRSGAAAPPPHRDRGGLSAGAIELDATPFSMRWEAPVRGGRSIESADKLR